MAKFKWDKYAEQEVVTIDVDGTNVIKSDTASIPTRTGVKIDDSTKKITVATNATDTEYLIAEDYVNTDTELIVYKVTDKTNLVLEA